MDSGITASISDLQIIGAGPAGIGMLLALCNRVAAAAAVDTAEQRILDSVKIYEASGSPGGKMAQYQINANTSAPDVVQGIHDGNPFVDIRDQFLQTDDAGHRLIALPRIGELFVAPLVEKLVGFLGDRLQCNVKVQSIEKSEKGFSSYDQDGKFLTLSKNLLLCCGGDDHPLASLQPYFERWEGSEQFLLRKSLQNLPEGDGDIVIVGASHSAFSCAWRLLHDSLFGDYAKNRNIIILQRRDQIKLRSSLEFAQQHHIEFDPETDVCPVTGLVFFNGGLRKDAKMLYLRIRDGEESRVKMLKINNINEQAQLLKQAALIIQATGFEPVLPAIESNGRPVKIGKPTETGQLREQDDGQIIEGLYGMGLGFNIGPMVGGSGEASFYGGIHGFQSYPISSAPNIINHLVA